MTKTRDGWLVLAGGVIGVPELTAGDLAAPGKSLLFGELRDEYCHLELSET